MNPYFLEYEIRPDQLPELSKSHGGFVLCHFPDSDDFKRSVSNTRFGRFIAGTEYEAYAVGNQFADAHDNLIEAKPSSARCQYILETAQGTFSLWYDRKSGNYYVQSKLPKTGYPTYTLLPERMDTDRTLVTYSDKLMQYLRSAFRNGNTIFDSPQSRNAFIEIFKR